MTIQNLFIQLQKVVPQRKLTRFASLFAESRNPLVKTALIKGFIPIFGVDMSEALYPNPSDYQSFNDFFTRRLKDGLRPPDDSERFVLSPVDGAISQLGDIHGDQIFQAKGHDYTVERLLGSREDALDFVDGTFATIYLSPKDYHRVHMPCAGTLIKSFYIPGDLYSVNQTTARNIPNLFARNERLVALFETEHGKMAMINVGAMIVAGIDTVWGHNPKSRDNPQTQWPDTPKLKVGDEMGRFYLGSTTILLFQKGEQAWLSGLEAGSTVRLGQAIGEYHES